jgi:hypothetical protein
MASFLCAAIFDRLFARLICSCPSMPIRTQASKEDVIAAAQAANIHKFILVGALSGDVPRWVLSPVFASSRHSLSSCCLLPSSQLALASGFGCEDIRSDFPCADSFLRLPMTQGLKDQYNTMIGTRGMALSGAFSAPQCVCHAFRLC